jgi:phage shock protein C
MACRRCGKDLDPDSAFCPFCGAAAVEPPPRRLTRVPLDGTVAGVCAGIANYLDTDVTLVRLAWIVLSIFPGAIIGGVIAYIAAWILMPEAPIGARAAVTGRRLRRSAADRKIAGVCGGLAEFLSIDPTLVRLGVVILSIYPGAIVCGVIAYLIAWAIIPSATETVRGSGVLTTS